MVEVYFFGLIVYWNNYYLVDGLVCFVIVYLLDIDLFVVDSDICFK